MNKICTDIEQSKKLIELGLDVNTADMLWTYDFVVNDINGLNVITDDFKPEEKDVPAWSLSALMVLIPTDDPKFKFAFRDIENNKIVWTFVCHAVSEYSFEGDSDFECMYKTVVWLKENNKL